MYMKGCFLSWDTQQNVNIVTFFMYVGCNILLIVIIFFALQLVKYFIMSFHQDPIESTLFFIY